MTAASQPKPVQTPSRTQLSGRALSSLRFFAGGWSGAAKGPVPAGRNNGLPFLQLPLQRTVCFSPGFRKDGPQIYGLLCAASARARGAAMSNPAAIDRDRAKQQKLGLPEEPRSCAQKGAFPAGRGKRRNLSGPWLPLQRTVCFSPSGFREDGPARLRFAFAWCSTRVGAGSGHEPQAGGDWPPKNTTTKV